MKNNRLAILVVGAVVFWIPACGKKEEKTFATPGGNVKTDKKSATYKGVDGTEVSVGKEGSVALPADFPEDVFVPQGKIFMAMKTPQGHNVSLKSTEKPEDIKSSLKEKLAAEGWTEERAVDLPNGGMLIYAKDGRKVHATIAGAGAETNVNITAN